MTGYISWQFNVNEPRYLIHINSALNGRIDEKRMLPWFKRLAV
jgi:hypothetical protein